MNFFGFTLFGVYSASESVGLHLFTHLGRAWWLMPALWEARWVDHLRSGVQDHPGQHSETLSLLKKEKLAGYGGAHL